MADTESFSNAREALDALLPRRPSIPESPAVIQVAAERWPDGAKLVEEVLARLNDHLGEFAKRQASPQRHPRPGRARH